MALPACAQSAPTGLSLASPSGVAYDSAGTLYIADTNHHLVREVDTNNQITIIAGTGEQGFAGDNGPATQALFDTPTGLAIAADGTIYVADSHNQRVRMIQKGIITTVAGNGIAGFSGDSAAAIQASLALPSAVALDASGNLYIADTNNHRVRKVTTTGTITTVAGNGDQFFSGDGASAIAAGLDSPSGVAIDSTGRILISDTHNQRVRAVDAQGNISTLAGNGAANFSGDGASAQSASLARPMGIASDSAGNVYIADTNNQRVRIISSKVITTLAGDGVQGFSGDGGLAPAASLNESRGVALGASGDVAVADTGNERVRIVSNNIINTAPVPGGGAPTLLLSGASTDVYGTGQITATLQHDSNPSATRITIFDNGQSVALVPLSGNSALYDTGKLSAGAHQIVAVLPGPGGSAGLSSSVFPLSISPAAITATAAPVTVSYGAPIPSITGTLAGVLPQDTGNVNAVFATTATSSSNVGTYPITVALAGPAAPSYTVAAAKNSGSVSITQAGSTTALGSPTANVIQTVPVTFTAKVNSDTTGAPSGNVTFLDGSTSLGTAPVTNGSATFNTSFAATGARAITARYAGDGNFAGSTSPAITVTSVAAYTIAVTPNKVQLAPAATASLSVAITPATGFGGTIALSCASLPASLKCGFAKQSVDGNSGASTVALQISHITFGPSSNATTGSPIPALGLWLPGLALSALGLRARKLTGPTRQTLLLLLLLVGLGGGAMLGCGSGKGPVAAPGTYTIQVIGTSGALNQSSPVVITVQ